jgi:hypothetical protein
MSSLQMYKISNKTNREATVSVFAPVLAPMFPTLPPTDSTTSSGLHLPFRDGTDPQFGGHRAVPGDRNPPDSGLGGMA